MDESLPTSASTGSPRWFHFILLLVIFAAGAGIRFNRLSSRSLWMDEYWSLYLSTGRGQPHEGIFDAPKGVLIDPPPATNFADAPPWWRIWTGMSSAVHPPLYHIVLRWWVDLFGDGDVAIRLLSALLGLIGVLLLFEMVWRAGGPWAALLAAALMLFSIAQIDLSCETRSYTLLVFLGLICCRTILGIEKRGASAGRLALLGSAAVAMALTHYFGAGFLAGIGIYGLARFKGKERAAVTFALITAALFVAVAWGPFFWSGRRLLVTQGDYPLPGTTRQVFGWLAVLPDRMILSPVHLTWLSTFPLFALVFVAPFFLTRRVPQLRLWLMWMAGGVGFVALFDVIRQTLMVSLYKLLLPAGPAIYAIVALQTPLTGKGARWRAPFLIFICAGAISAGVESAINIKQMAPPERVGLIYIVLMPFVIGAVVAGWRKSWPTWAIAAVGLTLTLNAALLATAGISVTIAVALILFAYIVLMATAPTADCRWLVPVAGTALVLWSVLTTCQWIAGGSVIVPKPDWRAAARAIDEHAGENETLAFTACRESNPAFCYIVYSHYSPQSHRPVIFLGDEGLSEETLASPAHRSRIWLIGSDPQSETSKYFPGWRAGHVISVPGNCEIWPVYPPGGAASN